MVAIFEPMHHAPRHIVEGGDRTAALERRRIGDRLGRQRPGPEVVRERNAELRAIRLLDQPQPAPAVGTERALARHPPFAGEAMRRQRHVDQPRAQHPQAGAGLPEPPHRLVQCRKIAPHQGKPSASSGPGATRPAEPCGAALGRGLYRGRASTHKTMMAGPVHIFDRPLLAARRRRALSQAAPGADFLLATVAGDLVDRLAAVSRHFPLAADIGSPLPLLADRLAGSGRVDSRCPARPRHRGPSFRRGIWASSATRRSCPSRRRASTSPSRRSRSNGSTTCPARSPRSAPR